MTLERELWIAATLLIALMLALAFGSTSLLVRMGPAIGRILEDNVASIIAAEEILSELASNSEAEDRDASVRASFARARENVTEEGEGAVLDRVERHLDAVTAGDRDATAVVVEALGRLIAINRDAMRQSDREAQRLGRAGAWAGVMLGAFALWLLVMIFFRMRRRLVDPLVELRRVLEAARTGDRQRRCRRQAAPLEVTQVVESVNRLLDERVLLDPASRAGARLESRALQHFLDAESAPIFVVTPKGAIARASSTGMELLSSDEGQPLREALERLDPETIPSESSETELSETESSATRVARDAAGAYAFESLGDAGWLCRPVRAD